MRFLSICSGVEAASVAWGPLGWKAAGFSEIEPFACATLAHHYPDVPNLGDMTEFAEWPDMGVDLVCGGTPCQAFSVGGLRKGLDDDRGNLALTFCKIVDRYRPRWVVWENVPGILNSEDNAFGCFLAELSGAVDPIKPTGGRWTNAGVVVGPSRTAAWRILDAQYTRVDGYPFAVPQRRRRVFVVARVGVSGGPPSVLFEPEGVRRHSGPRREAPAWRKGASRGVGGGFAASNFGQYAWSDVAGTLVTRMSFDQLLLEPQQREGTAPPPAPRGGGFAASSFGQYAWSDVAGTCRAVRRGDETLVVRPPGAVRRLTPRECERLQGFPDDYTRIPWRGSPKEDCPDTPRYRAIGNSWAVNCARWIGRRIELVEGYDMEEGV